MSTAVDPNLNPVIVAGAGGGGASLPATPAAALLDVASPNTFVVLDPAGIGTSITPADALAALYPRTVDTIPSAAPWVTRNGEGSYAGPATVNVGGSVDFSCVAASSQTLSAAGRAPWLSSASFVAMCRLSAFSSSSAADFVMVFFTDALNTQTILSGVKITGSGSCSFLREGGTTAGAQTVASITAGQGWAILVANGGDVAVYVGVGSGGAPPADSAWTYLGTVTRALTMAVPWRIFGVQLIRDAGSGNVTATAQTFTYGTAP